MSNVFRGILMFEELKTGLDINTFVCKKIYAYRSKRKLESLQALGQ